MKSGSVTITLKPGEVWTADQQCMAYCAASYLADWVPLFEGDTYKNTLKYEVAVNIDYGEDDPKHPSPKA